MATRTVGDAGSGAYYNHDTTALQLWESGEDDVGGTAVASVITDIEGIVYIAGSVWPNDSLISIVSSVVGTKRTITSAASSDHIIQLGIQTSITGCTFTMDDIVIDGSNAAAGKYNWRIIDGFVSTTFNRCRFTNAPAAGCHINAGSDATAHTLNNCIFDNCGTHGFEDADTGTTHTTTLNNCIAAENGSVGFNASNDADITLSCYNCLSMSNTGEDYVTNATMVMNLDSCVSSDATADTDQGHDTATDLVDGQTTYASYFVWTGSDYHRVASDTALSWPSAHANTPAEDYDNVTRTADSLGPFEFLGVAPTSHIRGPLGGPLTGPIG